MENINNDKIFSLFEDLKNTADVFCYGDSLVLGINLLCDKIELYARKIFIINEETCNFYLNYLGKIIDGIVRKLDENLEKINEYSEKDANNDIISQFSDLKEDYLKLNIEYSKEIINEVANKIFEFNEHPIKRNYGKGKENFNNIKKFNEKIAALSEKVSENYAAAKKVKNKQNITSENASVPEKWNDFPKNPSVAKNQIKSKQLNV